MKIRSLLLATLICIPAANHTMVEENPGAAVAIIGGLAAFGYGLYKLIDWATTPTNEQLLQDATRLINH